MKAVLLVILLFGSTAAGAMPVNWILNNVVFEAGSGYEEGSSEYGTASGSFVYDADTGAFSDVNIVNSGPNDPFGSDSGFYDWFGYNFGEGSNNPGVGTADFLIAHNTPAPFSQDPPHESLLLGFDESLTNAGGEVFLTLAVSGTYDYSPLPSTKRREIISGSVVASVVPVPAAAWLFGSALAGLGWIMRKQAA